MHVLLVHGLGRTALSMRRLGRRLAHAGHRPVYFNYLAWAERYDPIVARLAGVIARTDSGGEPWIAIGHSLGGLLLRAAVDAAAPDHLSRIIMLGTPNQPPRLAGRAARVRPFRWISGECGARLASADFYATLPPPQLPYALLAGTRGLHGRWSPFGDEPNDGIVALSEVRIRPDDPIVTFPVAHTFMMNHRLVQDAVLTLLAEDVRP